MHTLNFTERERPLFGGTEGRAGSRATVEASFDSERIVSLFPSFYQDYKEDMDLFDLMEKYTLTITQAGRLIRMCRKKKSNNGSKYFPAYYDHWRDQLPGSYDAKPGPFSVLQVRCPVCNRYHQPSVHAVRTTVAGKGHLTCRSCT